MYLVRNEDVAVKVDACWALSYLAEGGEVLIQVRMQALRKKYLGQMERGREDMIPPSLSQVVASG